MSTTIADADRCAEKLRRDGYALLPNAIDDDASDALRRFVYGELERCAEVFARLTGVALTDAPGVERYLASITGPDAAYQKLDKDLQHLLRGEFPLRVRLSREFLVVAQQRRLIEALAAALGEQTLRVHMPPMVRFKTPGHKQVDVPLHQDCSYNAHLENFLTAWVPLCPITNDCGGVDVLVGSHRLGPLRHDAQVIWNNCLSDQSLLDGFEKRHVTMGVGDVLLFGPYTLHRSHPNTSDSTRCSIDYRFFPRSAATTRHCYDLATQSLIAPAAAA